MSVCEAVNLMLHRQHWFPEYSLVTTLSCRLTGDTTNDIKQLLHVSSDLDRLRSTHCFMSSMVKLVRSGTSSSSTSGSSSSSSSTTGEAAGATEQVSGNIFKIVQRHHQIKSFN